MDAEQRKQCFDALAELIAVQPVKPAEVLDRLARREPAIKSGGRGEVPAIGSALFRLLADVEPRHLGRAVGRLKNGSEQTEGRGLSGAVGAEQAVDLAGLAAEVYAINGANVAAFAVVENLRQVDCFNHRLDRGGLYLSTLRASSFVLT